MTSDWNIAPKRKPDGKLAEGTVAPIDPSFSSHFAGGSLADAAGFLRNKPDTVDLDPRYFGVLDKQADWAKVVLCRLQDPRQEPDGAACILWEMAKSTLFLGGLDSDIDWDEMVRNLRYWPVL